MSQDMCFNDRYFRHKYAHKTVESDTTSPIYVCLYHPITRNLIRLYLFYAIKVLADIHRRDIKWQNEFLCQPRDT